MYIEAVDLFIGLVYGTINRKPMVLDSPDYGCPMFPETNSGIFGMVGMGPRSGKLVERLDRLDIG